MWHVQPERGVARLRGLPETILATLAPTAPTGVPAGWYQEGDTLRWWDGDGWTGHVAVATAAAEPAFDAAPAWDAPAPARSSGHGRLLGAIPRTLCRGARFDVLVYEHSIVLAKVPGTDPALIWAGVGFLVGFGPLIGYILGDYVAASGNRERVGQLVARDPASVAADGPRNRIVPRSAVRSGAVTSYGKAGGKFDLRLHDGTRVKHRWTRPHTKGTQPDGMLAQPLAGLATFKRTRQWALIVLVAVLALLVLVGVLATVYSGAADRAAFHRGRAEIQAPCAGFVELSRRVGEGYIPAPDEFAGVVDPLVPAFVRAVRHHEDFDAPAGAVVQLQYLAHTELRDAEFHETVDGYASMVYAACTW